MSIGMTLAAGADAELLEASVMFHLHAGVEHVTVVGAGSFAEEFSRLLEPYVATGRVAIREDAPSAQVAHSRHADWVIDAAPGEFWWPRGGSLDEVLTPALLHYDAVQALERRVLRSAGKPFFEHSTLRLAPTTPFHDPAWRPAQRLIRRASTERTGTKSELCVLRLWYPIEVLCVASADDSHGEDARRQQTVDVGALVEDTRLRDALRSLRGSDGERWLVPAIEGNRALDFPPISPVDDALFALDAAAIGDIDVLEARELLDVLSGRLSNVERMLLVRVEARLRAARREVRRRLRRGRAAS